MFNASPLAYELLPGTGWLPLLPSYAETRTYRFLSFTTTLPLEGGLDTFQKEAYLIVEKDELVIDYNQVVIHARKTSLLPDALMHYLLAPKTYTANMMRDAIHLNWRKMTKIIAFLIISIHTLSAQQVPEAETVRKATFKDTLDGQFDFSSFLIDSKGFMPIPMIITEPALGNFGGVLALAFFQPRTPPAGKNYVAPDITAALGMYTANGSWVAGGGRIASFPNAGIKYRVFAGYGDINLSFYRDIPSGQEQEFEFNIRSVPLLFNVSKSIGESDIYLGVQYTFSRTKVEPRFDLNVPDWVPSMDTDNRTGTVGLFGEIDKRNNFFTPDKGAYLHVAYGVDDTWTGSDYSYQRLTGMLHYFLRVKPGWISGFRIESEHVINDPPFYLLPAVIMRGIPVARYQGISTVLFETEQRFDFDLRWSLVAFGGLGKAIGANESFSDAETVYSFGTGFRYLIARQFGIRTGIDIARGPDDFAWYIVFGQNWNR